jgi:hypothetical protein
VDNPADTRFGFEPTDQNLGFHDRSTIPMGADI